MKIYNEKERAEQGKILEKRDTRMWDGAKSSEEVIELRDVIKGVVISRQDLSPA